MVRVIHSVSNDRSGLLTSLLASMELAVAVLEPRLRATGYDWYARRSRSRHARHSGYANWVVRWGRRMCAGRDSHRMDAELCLTTYRMWSTLGSGSRMQQQQQQQQQQQ